MPQPIRIEFIEAYELLDKLRSKTKSQIDLSDPLAEEEAYIQSLLYRCLDLGYGAFLSLKEEYLLTSLSAARNLVETIICFICYTQDLSSVKKENMEKINGLRRIYLYSQRHPNLQEIAETELSVHGILPEKTKAVNIMTQLNKCRDSYPELVETFEWLSEHTHPNALGTYHFFTYEDKEKNMICLDQHFCKDETIGWIKKSLSHLEIFEKLYNDLDTNIIPSLREFAILK